jgi:hypothetical protein
MRIRRKSFTMSSMVADLGSAVIMLVSLAVAGASTAAAQCTLPTEASLVRKSIRAEASCIDRTLRSTKTPTCRQETPPACAGTLVADAIALAYDVDVDADPPPGPVVPADVRAQLASPARSTSAVRSRTTSRPSCAV